MKPLYDRGGITIYHGDARAITPALGMFDFIFTDPPYGHTQNNGDLLSQIHKIHPHKNAAHHRHGEIRNDDAESASDLAKWLFTMAGQQLRCCCCCCCCCCGGGGPDPQFARWSLWMDEALEFKQMVVWDKGPMGMGWHYRRSYETILVAQKGKGKTRWFDDSHRIENIIRPGAHGIRKVIPKASDHPTPKPVALAEHFIRLHTQPGDVVFDPFMGGGSTAVAARNLGRKFIGIELSRRWVRHTIKRLEA